MVENNISENKREESISVCDVMKEGTTKVIHKLESQVPSLVQNYSNLYAEYLHMWDDLFGTCYISEKEYFDKLNINQETLNEIKKMSNVITNYNLNSIDIAVKFIEGYIKMRISAIKYFDNYAHIMTESYAKSLSEFNESIKPTK